MAWQRSSRSAVLSLCMAVVGGCVPATQTIVELDAEEALRGTGTLAIRIVGGDGQEAFRSDDPVDPAWAWPVEVPVSPLAGDAERRFSFSATLVEESGSEITVKAALGFAEGRLFRVRLRFESACRDVSCPVGLTCVDGSCVSVFQEAEECELEDGGDRGCDPLTNCGCPEGYACTTSYDQGTTCRARPPAAPCTDRATCASGEVCSLASGQCEAPTRCEAPPSIDGRGLPGDSCAVDGDDACGASLACVPAAFVLGSGLEFELTVGGRRCLPACNPCASSGECSAPDACIALPGGGGFCARSGLGLEDETCSLALGAERLCAVGLVCRTDRCRRACRNSFESVAGGSGHCAEVSVDCAADQVCVGPTDGPSSGSCARRGEEFPSPEGGLCTVDTTCPCPLRCAVTDDISDPRFCARRDIVDCAGCPAGTLCRQEGTEFACVTPGSLRRFDPCGTTAECMDGLSCQGRTCQPR